MPGRARLGKESLRIAHADQQRPGVVYGQQNSLAFAGQVEFDVPPIAEDKRASAVSEAVIAEFFASWPPLRQAAEIDDL